jgi:hypothetical protein
MRRSRRRRIALTLLVGLIGTGTAAIPPALVRAEERLVPLVEPAGQALLFRSPMRADFLPLSQWFVTQDTLAYCGVASAVMVLNSLSVPPPPTPGYSPYRFWTQENLFHRSVDRPGALSAAAVARRGMTLAQLAALLADQGVRVERWHGDQLSLAQLRGLLRQGLADPQDRLLVNYLRPALGQEGGGHISPLGAYDAAGDRVLILDVARYRYPSVWVSTADLWRAIRAIDPDSGASRGLVRIRRTAAAGEPPPGATPRSGP